MVLCLYNGLTNLLWWFVKAWDCMCGVYMCVHVCACILDGVLMFGRFFSTQNKVLNWDLKFPLEWSSLKRDGLECLLAGSFSSWWKRPNQPTSLYSVPQATVATAYNPQMFSPGTNLCAFQIQKGRTCSSIGSLMTLLNLPGVFEVVWSINSLAKILTTKCLYL